MKPDNVTDRRDERTGPPPTANGAASPTCDAQTPVLLRADGPPSDGERGLLRNLFAEVYRDAEAAEATGDDGPMRELLTLIRVDKAAIDEALAAYEAGDYRVL